MHDTNHSGPTGTVVTELTVGGMQCEHCKRAVFTSLSGLPGITEADVQLGHVRIVHDGRVTDAMLRDAIAVAGYTITDSASHPGRRALPLANE